MSRNFLRGDAVIGVAEDFVSVAIRTRDKRDWLAKTYDTTSATATAVHRAIAQRPLASIGAVELETGLARRIEGEARTPDAGAVPRQASSDERPEPRLVKTGS